MGHDRDPVRRESADRLDDLGAAFHLDRIHPCFFEETRRVPKSIGGARLVRPERHVADQEGPGRTARNGGRVADHVVHRHRYGRRIAEDDHAERIADEDDVDAGLCDEARERRVVCRHHRDALAVAFHRDEVGNGDLLRSRRWCRAAVLIAHF